MINSLSNININRDQNHTSEVSKNNGRDNTAYEALSEETSESNFIKHVSITDEEAEQKLPGHTIAFEGYHIYRAEGDTPEEALQKTLTDWRKIWSSNAYVPHRHQL